MHTVGMPCTPSKPCTPRQWALYQQAVVDFRFTDRTVRVAPALPGTADGRFPVAGGVTIHVFTAHNPHGRTASAEDNDRNLHRLLYEIDRRRLTWWPATGGSLDGAHVEESVAVVGMSDEAARELGRRFGQDAVFAWAPDAWRLLSCTDAGTAVYGWTASAAPRATG